MTSDPTPPLHSLDPLGRFSGRADDYARFRPDYPPEAIGTILRGVAPPVDVADVGAGTGISARLLADRGANVAAIEPNRAMREAASPHPRVRWVDGAAESTTLPDGTMAVVVAAQAFHWFKEAEALREFHRILRPGGRVALMWNHRAQDDPVTGEYSRLINQASGDHPAARERDFSGILASCPLFHRCWSASFPHAQLLDLSELMGRARSASYCPKDGPAWEALARGLARVVDVHGQSGSVALRYVTVVHAAEKRP